MSKSLGVLTLDLVAKIGGFTGPMDKASREAQRRSKEIERSMRSASDAIKTVVGALAAGAVFTKITQETINFQNEQAQLAAVLRSTGEAAGYSRDQLNNMATEMSRTSIISEGEINQAQTTLLAFTGIVGDEFPRALQSAIDMASRTGMSVVSASETIGRALDIPSKGLTALSRQGFRFTEDQKKLAEYLESTGRSAEAQGLILEALEESYGGAAQAARDTLGGALAALGNQFDSLMTGESGIDGATAAINDLTDTLSDPRIKEAFGAIASGVFSVMSAIAKATPHLVGFTTWVAESLAAAVSGPAAGDLVRISDAIEKQKTLVEGLAKMPGFDFGKNTPLQQRYAAEKKELERLQALYALSLDMPKPKAPAAPAAGQNGPTESELLEEAKRAEAVEKARKIAADAAAAAAKAAASAEKLRLDGIVSEITALERAAKTWGMTADEIKIYDLTTKGATESQINHARAQLELVSGLEKSKEAQEAYRDLVKDLRTDEERLTDELRERLAVMDAIADLGDDERNAMAGRVVASAFDVEEAPKFAGVDAGPLGELSKLDDAEKELNNWYSKQLEMLAVFREERADLSEQWDAQELELKQQHEDAMANIERSRWQAGLGAMSDFLTQTQALRDTDSKKGKAAAKTAAIAQATINAYTAATGAYASASAIPVVGWVLGPIAAGLALAAGLANVSKIKGQAHDGLDFVPSTGTYILERGEKVTTAATSAKLDATLDRVNAGMASSGRDTGRSRGSVSVNQTINVTGDVDRRTSTQIASDTARRQRIAAARLG